jgi:hypothetical protein
VSANHLTAEQRGYTRRTATSIAIVAIRVDHPHDMHPGLVASLIDDALRLPGTIMRYGWTCSPTHASVLGVRPRRVDTERWHAEESVPAHQGLSA